MFWSAWASITRCRGASCSPSLTFWSCSPPAFHHPITSGTALPKNWLGEKRVIFSWINSPVWFPAWLHKCLRWHNWKDAVRMGMSSPRSEEEDARNCMQHRNIVCALGTLRCDPHWSTYGVLKGLVCSTVCKCRWWWMWKVNVFCQNTCTSWIYRARSFNRALLNLRLIFLHDHHRNSRVVSHCQIFLSTYCKWEIHVINKVRCLIA